MLCCNIFVMDNHNKKLIKGRKMLKKAVIGLLVLATSTLFGMSLQKLNTASKAELMKINGIGEKKADAIIKERRKGKFKSFEDFQRVDGIGEETAKNVKNDVKVKPESAKNPKKIKKKVVPSRKKHRKQTNLQHQKKSSTKKKKGTVRNFVSDGYAATTSALSEL